MAFRNLSLALRFQSRKPALQPPIPDCILDMFNNHTNTLCTRWDKFTEERPRGCGCGDDGEAESAFPQELHSHCRRGTLQSFPYSIREHHTGLRGEARGKSCSMEQKYSQVHSTRVRGDHVLGTGDGEVRQDCTLHDRMAWGPLSEAQ